MTLETRKILDKSFSWFGFFSIFLLAVSLLVILGPIVVKGIGAVAFVSTIEHRKIQFEKFNRGNEDKLANELIEINNKRKFIYDSIDKFEKEMKEMSYSERKKYKSSFKEFKHCVYDLLGPNPSEELPVLMRLQYGKTRWKKAKECLQECLNSEEWMYPDDAEAYIKYSPRSETFKDTSLEPVFSYLEENFQEMMNPKFTMYWGFFADKSFDSHFFGGIFPEIMGTLYLTIGAMLFAIPLGVIAAIYLTEFAKDGKIISFLRICISTLAGVPSIVFGLFGLAFFINVLNVSDSKSVLAGSLTLALLVIPTIIRAAEEAIRSVPQTYKEAAMSLGASKWHTVVSVILPAALPGIITGIIISMGRAAGETAPIIFTAAVSVGRTLKLDEVFSQPTPALSWNIYNLTTEHEAVDQIRHVQFGMVFTLILIVITLNLTAIFLRARISKKLRG